MLKELIISIVIIVIIFIGNSFTENYTIESINQTSDDLAKLREYLIKDENEIISEVVEEKINEIHEKWDTKYEKLAYYIEHDELEKVETELTSLRGYIEIKEFSDAVPELDKSVYILEHIKSKTAFNLRNIF